MSDIFDIPNDSTADSEKGKINSLELATLLLVMGLLGKLPFKSIDRYTDRRI